MTSTNISTRTVASALANNIRSDIINGTLGPGMRLRIKDLCNLYESGPIPLREALSRLATSGFVIAEDQRGFRVADVSTEELLDITETRIHIECEALRRSIIHGDLNWEEQVTLTHYRLSRLPVSVPGDHGISPAWEQAHVEFHTALISGSGSRWMIGLAELLRDQTSRYRHLSVELLPDEKQGAAPSRDVMVEHDQLAQAALARETEKAVSLLRDHLNETTKRVLAQNK